MALEGKKIPYNPEAAKLANKYVPEILKAMGRAKVAEKLPESCQEIAKQLPENNQDLTKKPPHNFQETEKDWELSEEDIAALEQIPL